MAEEVPQLKLYEPYRDNILAQEDLLYRTLQTHIKTLKDVQIKLKNQKDVLLKGLKGRLTGLPETLLLGATYSKVFDGMGRNVQAEGEYVKKMEEIVGNLEKRKEEVKRVKDEIGKVVNTHKKMKNDHQAFIAISKTPEKKGLGPAENLYRNSKTGFESTEKTALEMIQIFEREKVDSTLVLQKDCNEN